jgi:predicted anti-sigma-YlaC factor YlaD
MDCREIKEKLQLLVGDLRPDDTIQHHLDTCPECREYFETLQQFEKTMQSIRIEPMSAVEFAVVREKLDSRIGRYVDRAVGSYHLLVRYGTSLAAILLILFISLVSDIKVNQSGTNDTGTTTQQLATTVSDTTYTYLEEGYVDDLFNDYVQTYGSYAGQLLLGDLYEDEYDYLNKNIKAGDIM